jgi:hypothetical protein
VPESVFKTLKGHLMRKIVLVAALLLPATALALPCPKGKNVRLQDTTAASQVAAQQAARARQAADSSSNSAGNTTQAVSLRNHYPH